MLNYNLKQFIRLRGSRVDWRETEKAIRAWIMEFPGTSKAADDLSVLEIKQQLKQMVRKFGSRVIVEVAKEPDIL